MIRQNKTSKTIIDAGYKFICASEYVKKKKLIKKNLFTKYLSEEVKNEKRIMEHTTAIDLLPKK